FLTIEAALETADVAIGIKDQDYYRHLPATRVRISKFLQAVIRFVFDMPVADTQCGLKGFNKNGKSVFLRTTINRYLCDLEFVYLCYRPPRELKVVNREVSLRDQVNFGRMNLRILATEAINLLKIV